mmetsp:Transcript_550/g.1025  ORF Transcript_550/g.1025 Transcript_550/m.1025 type:complete len:141 (-) Transcript_550:47-469(-)
MALRTVWRSARALPRWNFRRNLSSLSEAEEKNVVEEEPDPEIADQNAEKNFMQSSTRLVAMAEDHISEKDPQWRTIRHDATRPLKSLTMEQVVELLTDSKRGQDVGALATQYKVDQAQVETLLKHTQIPIDGESPFSKKE